METAKRFEDLWIWQQARELVREVYEDFRAGPSSKDFGFRDQIQRAGVSIMNNLAEGFERTTDADFARFLDVAKGSCGEVRSITTRPKSSPTSMQRARKPDGRKRDRFRPGLLP